MIYKVNKNVQSLFSVWHCNPQESSFHKHLSIEQSSYLLNRRQFCVGFGVGTFVGEVVGEAVGCDVGFDVGDVEGEVVG